MEQSIEFPESKDDDHPTLVVNNWFAPTENYLHSSQTVEFVFRGKFKVKNGQTQIVEYWVVQSNALYPQQT